jgi:large repetitive protein
MSKADNKLGGARNLGVLGADPLRLGDKFKPTDTETLYRFGLDKSSSFNLSLSGLAKKTNADVELYRMKRPANEVISLMGNRDFRLVSGSIRDNSLALMATSKRKGNKNENLALSSLETGDYVVRVLGRSGKSSYSLQVAATAISSSVKPVTSSGDKIAPTATLNAANFVAEGSTTYDFTVTYSDNVAINMSSLDNNDVLVTGSNGFSQLATKVVGGDSNNGISSTATYRITAPVGTWSLAENGSYSVALQANQVSDSNGNFAPAASLGSFLMNTPLRGLKFSGSSNASAATDFVFDIDTSTGILKKFETTFLDFTPIRYTYGSTKLEVVLKSLNGPTDEFNNLINIPGLQGVFGKFKDSQIVFRAKLEDDADVFLGITTSNTDLSDPFALLAVALDDETPGTKISKGTFSKGIVTETFTYTTIPSANLSRAGTAKYFSDGTSTYDFDVTYSDNAAIDFSSIDDSDIEVTGPNGFSQVAKKVAVNNSGNGSPLTVTYRITGTTTNWNTPEGNLPFGIPDSFHDFLSFAYDVKLRANQVKDINGNFVPSGKFSGSGLRGHIL